MGVRFLRSLWEPEVLIVHEFFTELLSMEGKYAVKLSITELFNISTPALLSPSTLSSRRSSAADRQSVKREYVPS